jgi:hypothetical protein
MQELIIFFLIAFVIVASLLLKSSYSFDVEDQPSPILRKKQNMNNYEKAAMLYNIKYHEFPPLYIDHQFGSASGGNNFFINEKT